jgi:hypothetical protein
VGIASLFPKRGMALVTMLGGEHLVCMGLEIAPGTWCRCCLPKGINKASKTLELGDLEYNRHISHSSRTSCFFSGAGEICRGLSLTAETELLTSRWPLVRAISFFSYVEAFRDVLWSGLSKRLSKSIFSCEEFWRDPPWRLGEETFLVLFKLRLAIPV